MKKRIRDFLGSSDLRKVWRRKVLCICGMLGVLSVMTAQAAPAETTGGQTQDVPAEAVDGQTQAAPSYSGQLQLTQSVTKSSGQAAGKIILTVSASPISYGQLLKQSEISVSAKDEAGNPVEVPGTFSWQTPDTRMEAVGVVSQTIVYTTASGTGEQPDAGAGTESSVHAGLDAAAADPAKSGTPAQDAALLEGTAAGTAAQATGAPVTYSIWLTVKPGITRIETKPEISHKATAFDGDTLDEVLSVSGGKVICELAATAKEPAKKEAVSGKFVWKDADTPLAAGKETRELLFVPNDPAKYQPVSMNVDMEVKARPVGLTLELSPKTVKPDQEVILTAGIRKTDKLSRIGKEVRFLADGKEIGRKEWTETETGWSAQLVWKPEAAGSYELTAFYEPEDEKTAAEETAIQRVEVAAPVSRILPEKLPDGRVGKAYAGQLETDASGRFEVIFSVSEGALPDGLTLEKTDGTLTGMPTKSGEFLFTITAQEGTDSVSREYRISIAPKLAFSIECDDIEYGQAVSPKVKVSGSPEAKASYKYRLTYEGMNGTDYAESKEAPVFPGSYRVKAVFTEPADYADTEIFCNFTIRKAVPKLTLSANSVKFTGGGECRVEAGLENPYDAALTEKLPDKLTIDFSRDVKLSQNLSGSGGSYQFAFQTGSSAGKISCSVKSAENDCYQAAVAVLEVTVIKKEEKPSGGGKSSGSKPSSEQEEEPPEPVVKTPEEVEADFWQDVIFRIYKAQEKGDTVTINAKGHGSMTDKVLEALRQHEKVTLALVWEGDMIVIPAGKAPASDKSHQTWTLAELSKLFPLAKPGTTTQQGQSSNQTQAPDTAGMPGASTEKPGTAAGGPQTANTAPANHASSTANSNSNSSNGSDSGKTMTDEEAESTEAAESESVEAAETETETTTDSAPASEPENVPAVAEPKETDWFLIAVIACALCGILAILLAVIALSGRKKRRDEYRVQKEEAEAYDDGDEPDNDEYGDEPGDGEETENDGYGDSFEVKYEEDDYDLK